VEKKPFFHFIPDAASLATAGCNVTVICRTGIPDPAGRRTQLLPVAEEILEAKKYDCQTIAYTYSEPTIYYEYMMDCVLAGRKKGIKNVVVTAGYIARDPLIELCKVVDAIKVDLKAFSDTYYKDIVNGELKPGGQLVTMRKLNVDRDGGYQPK
jgi:pyruvate formate lyase activating enzyme